MKTAFSCVLRLGSAVLTMGLPLLLTGCGGGGDLPPTQTVRGVVLLDTGIGSNDPDPLAGLTVVPQTEVKIFTFGDGNASPFRNTPHPKTDSQGRFSLQPIRGTSSFYLNIANRCSNTSALIVNSDGTVQVTASSANNFNGALLPLQQRAIEALAALQANNPTEKPDVLILVSDQQDACTL